MKQTKNHKLNLIEMSDTFSTEPLNENMEAIDAALKAAGDTAAAISKRVGTLEAKHIAIGTYRGQSSGYITISVGFTPTAVFIGGGASNLIVDQVDGGDGGAYARLTTGGFTVQGGSGPYGMSSKKYNYVAIG